MANDFQTETWAERLADWSATIPEAAFVSGLSVRAVNQEITERIIRPRQADGMRVLGGEDLVYLGAIRTSRTQMGRDLRRLLRGAIAAAVASNADDATFDRFKVGLAPIEREVHGVFQLLAKIKRDHIEVRPDILAGEPTLKGTRIAARLIAELVKRGAPRAEIEVEFDLDADAIEAAVIFDRVAPKIGRPTSRRTAIADVSAA